MPSTPGGDAAERPIHNRREVSALRREHCDDRSRLRHLEVLNKTPFYDIDSFAVLKTTAAKYGLKTIGDVKKVPNPSYGGYPRVPHAHHLSPRPAEHLRAEEPEVRPTGDDPGGDPYRCGADRGEERRHRGRLQVHLDRERRQREADQRGDDRDEQGGRYRQEDARRRRQGFPEGERHGLDASSGTGPFGACPRISGNLRFGGDGSDEIGLPRAGDPHRARPDAARGHSRRTIERTGDARAGGSRAHGGYPLDRRARVTVGRPNLRAHNGRRRPE